jgi:acyl carrier protein
MDETIRDIVRTQARLARREVSDDDNLFQAGMTSHSTVNVMLALEAAFDIEFPERLLRRETFASVSTIRAAVSELFAPGDNG